MATVEIEDRNGLLNELLELQANSQYATIGSNDTEIGDLQEKVKKIISHLESVEEENKKRKNEKKEKEKDVFGFSSNSENSDKDDIFGLKNIVKTSSKVEIAQKRPMKNIVDSDDSLVSNSSKNSKSSKLSKYGESELQLAAAEGNFEKVQNCLNCGMSVSHRDFNKLTPLHDATKNEHLKVIEILLKNESPVDAVGGEKNSTPLHFAAENENIKIVKLLLEYGADPAKKDSNGQEAGDLTINKKIIQLIKKAKSKYTNSTSESSNSGELPPPPTEQIVFYHASLDPKAKKITKMNLKSLKKKYDKTFTTDIKKATHFVCDKELITDKKYIVDYLEALYHNCWIVSEEYLIGESQSNKNYLITSFDNAPQRAIIAATEQDPPVLRGLKIFFDRTVSADQKKRLDQIAKTAGARILNREPKPDSDAVQADPEVVLSRSNFQYTHVIVYQTDKRAIFKRGKVATAHIDWLIQSLAHFSVRDI